MKGFLFDVIENPKKKKIADKEKKKKVLKDDCEKCGLYKNCLSPKMKVYGYGKKKILIVGEAPGREEDEQGIPFIGRSGQLLRTTLSSYGIDMEKDCWITNTCICRPKNNVSPTNAQINYCRFNLMKVVEELKPEKIITLGKTALQGLIGNKIKIGTIDNWFGQVIPDQDFKCFIFPDFHPAYILRNENDVILKELFSSTLYQAVSYSTEFSMFIPKEIDIKNDYNQTMRFLSSIKKKDTIVFDYETTGIKPHKEGHEIICISICNGKEVKVFEIFEDKLFKKELKRILEDPEIKKIAHNLKFEHQWSNKILGVNINGWWWDTMVTNHVLDNRIGNGLKYLSYIYFGVCGYDSEMNFYLKSKEKSSNAFNNIKQAPKEKLFYYCGMDSDLTFRLYLKQRKEIQSSDKESIKFFRDGIIAFAEMQTNGIRFNYKGYEEQYKILAKKIDEIDKKIQNAKEVKSLKLEKDFNSSSSKQMRELLKSMKVEVGKKTAKAKEASTDKHSLAKINSIITNNILEYRNLMKIRDTFLGQFEREAIRKENGDYYIYPNFNLHTVKTFRSSSSDPNFQNIPVRNEYANNLIRGLLFPSRGNQLLEVDLKAIEVAISVCYHKDPVMIKYVTDKNTDMHRDMAKEIFILKDKEVTKRLRYIAKNGFVFPEFYGSTCRIFKEEHEKIGAGDVTQNIWEMLDKEQKEMLREKKLGDIKRFQKHIEKIENNFWYKKFVRYTEWKSEILNQYNEDGFVELKTGFKCYAPMGRNDVLNYPIQGAAFHCLLWSLIQINKYIKQNNLKTKIIGQIHDSIVFDLYPKEKNMILKRVKQIIEQDIREYWKWIIVPLSFEAEITDIDESWNKKRRIDI